MPVSLQSYPAEVLLSFDWEDQEQAEELKREIEARTQFQVVWATDREVSPGDSLQAKTINLVMASVLIVLIGKTWNTYQEFELTSARQMKIPIIGVSVYGDLSTKPKIVQSLNIPLVDWDWHSIVPILNGHVPTIDYENRIADSSKNSIVLLDFKEIALAITREITKNPHTLHSLSPRQFEELVAYLMERKGYEVSLTQQSRDGGIDIFAIKKSAFGELLTIVDCKKYASNRPVGVELVRTMYGTLVMEHASHAIVATTSRFTEDAKTAANTYRYQISLKDHVDILNWMKQS